MTVKFIGFFWDNTYW